MTKEQLQKELDEKIKPGVKPSHLKRSKSADDIPASPASSEKQNTNLQEQVKFHTQTAQNYLQSLQTSQAKVSELETQIKSNPPNPLLQEQLKEKQQEVENLRKKLEEKNEELKTLKQEQSNLLDDNLSLKHQGLKDWFKEYEKRKGLEKELAENINEASDELIEQDKVIGKLRSENTRLKQEKQSLQKDLKLATKLAEMRRIPYPDDNPNWDYLKYPLYSLVLVLFTLWITNNLRKDQQ